MIDAADKAASDDERAMALFEEQMRRRRIADSMRPYDPTQPIDCVECGEPVSVERQRAYPHTRRCVRCAAEAEALYRRGAPT